VRLWAIHFEERAGDEYFVLIASRSMDIAKAAQYALRHLKHIEPRYRYDDSDIETIEYQEIKEVMHYSNGKSYDVKLYSKNRGIV
jgi:hypothetical protein